MATSDGRSRAVVERSWRPLLVIALLAGVLVTGIGESVSAGSAPEIGVVDDWGRIDEAAGRVASWPYLLVLVAVFVVLYGLSSSSTGRFVRNVRFALAVELMLFVAVAVLGIVAIGDRVADADSIGGQGRIPYYTDGERVGQTIVYAALLVIAATLVIVIVRQLLDEDTGTSEP